VTAIKIENFVGEMPSVSPRKLGATGAQVALDIHADTNEFIPLLADADKAAGVAGAKTLFLLERDASGVVSNAAAFGAWLVHSDLRSYARCQIKDNKTARTVRSYDDVDQAPEILTSTNSFATATPTTKLLGVPAPTVAPLVKLIASEEFTADDREAMVSDRVKEAIKVIRTSAIVDRIGMVAPPEKGYLDATEWAKGSYVRVFQVGKQGVSDVENSYTDNLLESFAWVGDAGGYEANSGAGTPFANGTSWQTADKWHRCLEFRAYANGYKFDEKALGNALAAIDRLNEVETPPKKLFTEEQAKELVAKLVSYVDQKGTGAGAKVSSFTKALGDLKTMFLGVGNATAADWTKFFDTSAQAKEIVKEAIATFASKVYELHIRIYNMDGYTFYTFNLGRLNAASDEGRASIISQVTDRCNNNFLPPTSGPNTFGDSFDTFIKGEFLNSVPAGGYTVNVIYSEAIAALTALRTATGPSVWGDIPGCPKPSADATKALAISVKGTISDLGIYGEALDRYYGTLENSSTDTSLDTLVNTFMKGVDTAAVMPDVEKRILEDRFYGYTWVTGWGEESSMSPLGIMVQADTAVPQCGQYSGGWVPTGARLVDYQQKAKYRRGLNRLRGAKDRHSQYLRGNWSSSHWNNGV